MTTIHANDTNAFKQVGNALPPATNPDTEAFGQKFVVARREIAPVWLSETIIKLDHLSTLEENWDSYGATRIDHHSIGKASELVSYLGMFVGVDAPAVGGTPNGHVGFSWDDGAWSLDAEVLPDGRVEYVYLDERDSANDREAITQEWADLLELLTQLPDPA